MALSKILGVDSEAVHILVGCSAGILIPILIANLAQRYNINYLFSAPLSNWFSFCLKPHQKF